MEIIKDLPSAFEEFAEARRNAFVGVKDVKDAGIPVIGSYCTYFPRLIIQHRTLRSSIHESLHL